MKNGWQPKAHKCVLPCAAPMGTVDWVAAKTNWVKHNDRAASRNICQPWSRCRQTWLLAVVAGDAVKAAGLQNCSGLPVAEKLKIKQLGNLGYRICPWSLCNSTKKARKQLSEKTEETPAGPPWNPVFDLQQVPHAGVVGDSVERPDRRRRRRQRRLEVIGDCIQGMRAENY